LVQQLTQEDQFWCFIDHLIKCIVLTEPVRFEKRTRSSPADDASDILLLHCYSNKYVSK